MIGEFLASRGISYAVIGGFGLHAHGLSRPTYDLDLVTAGESQAVVLGFMESLGYETLHVSSGYSNHGHRDGAFGRVDFVYVRGETERALFESAQEREILEGINAPVLKPEHLIAMKLHALANDPARLHGELADIRDLIALDGVDRAEVRARFEKHGMLATYDELIETL